MLNLEEERKTENLVTDINWLCQTLGVLTLQKMRNDEIRRELDKEVTWLDIIKQRRLKGFGHVSRMEANKLPYLVMHTVVESVRSRGRQRTRWRDDFFKDIKEKGLNPEEAMGIDKRYR